jgi:multiple sugar transport system ATP-binding protein
MIYVTHDQIEAMTLADRIAIMREGKIQQLSSPDEIYNRPLTKYVAEFIGSPSMNFFEGEINGSTFTTTGTEIALDNYNWMNGAVSGQAWLGVRPEHVAVGNAAEAMPFQSEIDVELFEPMGSDTLIYSSLAGKEFHFRMDGQIKVADGDRLKIGFDVARASMFNVATEDRL